jgi:hypothetical protein
VQSTQQLIARMHLCLHFPDTDLSGWINGQMAP